MRRILLTAAVALLIVLAPAASYAGRGGYARPAGGFDMHGDGGAYHPPQSASHSSTGPYGTNRSTTVNNTGNGYNRTTTATNGS
jgi:hypothetical protein